MSQWILLALCLLAHPLMMLFMHKGMHGGSGSMDCCGNNTQQNSNNTEKPRKKLIDGQWINLEESELWIKSYKIFQ